MTILLSADGFSFHSNEQMLLTQRLYLSTPKFFNDVRHIPRSSITGLHGNFKHNFMWSANTVFF